MDKQDRIWQLYARKMAREATEEELQELAGLIRDDPSMDMQLQLMTEFWNNSSPIRSEQGDEAFNRILEQAGESEMTSQPVKPVITRIPDLKPRKKAAFSSFNRAILHNYAAVAWRSLVRNKSFSAINIAGLALGMVSAVVILLWISNELSFDQFHKRPHLPGDEQGYIRRGNCCLGSYSQTPVTPASARLPAGGNFHPHQLGQFVCSACRQPAVPGSGLSDRPRFSQHIRFPFDQRRS
jgi:hypothetical protein